MPTLSSQTLILFQNTNPTLIIMGMNEPHEISFSKHSSSSWGRDILIKRILLTHEPESRTRDLDSELLLQVIESIMHHATPSRASSGQQDSYDVSGFEVDGAHYKISCEILCEAYQEKNQDASTMSVLNLLGCYRWGDKVVLALLAFAMVYGKFWVIMQSQNQNSLATLIAILEQFPNDINEFKPHFMGLSSLVKTMVEVIRCVAEFEHLPIVHVEVQDELVTTTKSLIYLATYWVVRSAIMCISLLANLKDEKNEGLFSTSTWAWEITGMKIKISTIGSQLRAQVDLCQQQTERKMHTKLRNIFQEKHSDNQEVIRMLFALNNEFPVNRNSDKPKLGISSLKEKVVILLISKPELLPLEELLFLVHQTYNNPLHAGTYDLVWFPISTSSKKWSNNEITIFNYLSNSLPWCSIRQPWSISSITINYAKQEWGYKEEEEPIMVVLDAMGRVTNLNTSDMIWIWGAKAYPFSITREKELWNEEKWSLKLLLNDINPLFTMWVQEERTICIYGSSKLDWVRRFCAKINDIRNLVPHLEVVYVGRKDPNKLVSDIVSVIEKEKLSNTLSFTKIHFFWQCLYSMRRSKIRLGETIDTDHILREVEALLHTDDTDEDWMIIGEGSSTNLIKLRDDDWVEFLGQYPVWKRYLPKIGLVDAIRLFLKPPTEACSNSRIIRYNERLEEEEVICEKCKHPIEKFTMYDVVE